MSLLHCHIFPPRTPPFLIYIPTLPPHPLVTTTTNVFAAAPPKMPTPLSLLLLFTTLILISTSHSSPILQTLTINSSLEFINPKLPPRALTASNKFEGSSDLVHLKYHMGPVLTSTPINIYLIWYGRWPNSHKLIIKDFLNSLSLAEACTPSVSQWWRTVSQYADQTNSNVSRAVLIAKEYVDAGYSKGKALTRLSVQEVIANAVKMAPFPVDHRNGIYLILTSQDVTMQDFCRAVCGFHYFTFPSMVGYTLPYAWVGNSGKQCPEVCAYPFAVPGYMQGGGLAALKPPNGEVGVDGMVSIIGHELAELASNPLINAWYAGEDPTAPTEIGDLCEGLYGTGGGGGYIGQIMRDKEGRSFNMNGRRGRRFLVQWIWSNEVKACVGPNAID